MAAIEPPLIQKLPNLRPRPDEGIAAWIAPARQERPTTSVAPHMPIKSSPRRRLPIDFYACLAVLCLGGLVSHSAHAQVQRSFFNGSFEIPAPSTTGSCFTQVPDSAVPGWSTSHSEMAPSIYADCPPPLAPASGPASLIELWANGYQDVNAREGRVLAELNAEESSTLSQTLCINSGEQVIWSLSHRGRGGVDQMQVYLGNDPDVGRVLTASTGLSGDTTIDACQNGSAIMQDTPCSSVSAAANGTQWGDYAGAFTWTGASGDLSFNFGALDAAWGLTQGNFLDNISVRLAPYVELSAGTADNLQVSESEGALNLGIKVSGELSSAQAVSVSIIGGSATLGADYTTPNGLATFVVTIPAGVYAGTMTTSLGITVIDDALIEGNETIQLAINANPTAYLIQSTSVCGGPQNASIIFTIQDDDSLASPLASNDAATTNFDTPVTQSVWSNDTAPSGSSLVGSTVDLDPSSPAVQTTITVVGQGTFTSNGNGTVTFTPAAGFVGVVSVPYTIADSFGRMSNQATITVTVRDLTSSATPIANKDISSTAPATPVSINVLTNDAPGAGNSLDLTSVTLSSTNPAQGTWSVDPATGVVTFTPAAGFSGTATATYTVTDSGTGVSNVATISVTVRSAPTTVAIPTLSQWTLMLLSTLLLVSLPHLRRITTSSRQRP